MLNKVLWVLVILTLGGCSLNASFTCGQEYDFVDTVSAEELNEFWAKIEGEMNPDSIWGDAKTDQERCQAEANYMAKYYKFCHVGPCIGRFEGIGWSRSGNMPGTCVPKYRMCLTGDATATCEDGTVIRVRSWR